PLERPPPAHTRAERRGRHRPARCRVPLVTTVQYLIDGVSLGALYGLVAIGIALVFGVMRLINFAYGELITAGGYTLAYLNGQPAIVGILACIGVVLALALVQERVAFRPLRGASPATMVGATARRAREPRDRVRVPALRSARVGGQHPAHRPGSARHARLRRAGDDLRARRRRGRRARPPAERDPRRLRDRLRHVVRRRPPA